MRRTNTVWAIAMLIAFGLDAGPSLGQASAHERTVKNQTLSASVSADGSYELDFAASGWKLRGKLVGDPGRPQIIKGEDRIGVYREIDATFADGSRLAGIRVYDSRPLVLLRDEWKSAGADAMPFPQFESLPAGTERLSFQSKNFGFFQFGTQNPEGPWVLFDGQNHAIEISPADHFLVSRMEDGAGGVSSTLDPAITSIPAGFVHSTLIAAGSGVNDVFGTWGAALLALGGKQPAPNNADVTLAKLGYWTDNKTFYYYKFDEKLGYAGTLLAVRDEFKRLGVPLGYMQLDSWFYPKGPESRWDTKGNTPEWGEVVYRADKTLFPQGLKAFQQQLGLPMVTHARWLAPQSPYRKEFKVSGNVVIDPRFWKETADYLHDADVVTYEQDWLDKNAHAAVNLTDPSAFLGDMANAMGADGLSIQYCMPLPSDYMASTLYPSVQTIRTSGDGFERNKWDEFLFDSRLANSLGLWPWTDAFFSKDLGNLVISTLSAGPVGVGDAIGSFDVKNLMSVVRTDGTIIKPDTSLVPIDAVYQRDADGQRAPMVATATTSFGSGRVLYVFAYPRREEDTSTEVRLQDLGVKGAVVAYNWKTHEATLLKADATLPMEFTDGWAYEMLVPVNDKGLALLGDTGKITPLGKARIASVNGDGRLVATVLFADGEGPRTISGYAPVRPRIKAVKGTVHDVRYDGGTHLFSVEVQGSVTHEAVIEVSAK